MIIREPVFQGDYSCTNCYDQESRPWSVGYLTSSWEELVEHISQIYKKRFFDYWIPFESWELLNSYKYRWQISRGYLRCSSIRLLCLLWINQADVRNLHVPPLSKTFLFGLPFPIWQEKFTFIETIDRWWSPLLLISWSSHLDQMKATQQQPVMKKHLHKCGGGGVEVE